MNETIFKSIEVQRKQKKTARLDKRCFKKHTKQNNDVVFIGIHFSEQERNITGFAVEEMGM